jgi:hypothetical protein
MFDFMRRKWKHGEKIRVGFWTVVGNFLLRIGYLHFDEDN